ncbi:MAG: HAMP domain-containing histidine kinase [Nitrospirae bacterium]|nr:HAMP domain-containing histidine kinase [Nitrospirota bacterium]
MYVPGLFNKIKYLLSFALLSFIWLVLAMVWFDRFIPPFDRLIPYLMPWKGFFAIPVKASLEKKLSIMQELLDLSNRVANIAFIILIVSFTIFSGYLTFVYQQKQRRARENRLLLMKNQEIARRNEFIRYISATIGHEFKNNLGRIKRRIDLLSDIPQDAITRIDENLDKLFADIDIFKKISDEREAILIDFKKVNLTEMLKDMAKQYTDMADIIFQNEMPALAIFASQTLLKTVFENIMDNAVKYKKSEQSRAQVLISFAMDIDGRRRYVSLSFRDKGIGMDEQQADRCFYKGKSIGEGWGEGLYFAKYVVGLHAGRIKVGKEYTLPDVGAEIIINLPFVEEAINV